MRHKSKLIDANAFEDEIRNGWQYDIPDVIKTLRDFPVAYDIDKVIEELRVLYEMVRIDQKLAVSQAIEIVKKGGNE